jgi:hypothetical protein
MGMDIAFDRQRAIDNGIEIKEEQRGSSEEILMAAQDGASTDYLEWLEGMSTLIRVPEMRVPETGNEFWVEADKGGNDLIVRANRWGMTYGPLTSWLDSKGIGWETF